MGEKTAETVFAPFYTTKVGGTGLGLAITQKIVLEHEGNIVVHSRLGQGSTFEVRLPVALPGQTASARQATDSHTET